MISSLVRAGGRGFAVAILATVMITIVVMLGTIALFFDKIPSGDWADIVGKFILALGGMGTAMQAPNVVERLPGKREFPPNLTMEDK